MKRILCLLLLFIGVQNTIKAELSSWAEVYLLTYAPGNDIYSIFGHSAIRIRDPMNEMDIVYNYGTFDFNAPYFYFRFIRGNLRYQLSKTTFEAAMQQMVIENRSVYEQRLNLRHEKILKLYEILKTNYLPQNRFYTYGFFERNCATKIRDDLYKLFNDSLKLSGPETKKTYRQILYEYTQFKPWVKMGIDLLLSPMADNHCSDYNSMFLPEYLSLNIRKTRIHSEENGYKQLSNRPVRILDTSASEQKKPWGPYIIFTLLLLIFISINIASSIPERIKLNSRGIVLTFASILTLIILFITLLSKHPEITSNLNLIWLLPSVFCLFSLMLRVKLPALIHTSACSIQVLAISIVLIFQNKIPQEIPLTFLPLQLMLISTGLFELFLKKKPY